MKKTVNPLTKIAEEISELVSYDCISQVHFMVLDVLCQVDLVVTCNTGVVGFKFLQGHFPNLLFFFSFSLFLLLFFAHFFIIIA